MDEGDDEGDEKERGEEPGYDGEGLREAVGDEMEKGEEEGDVGEDSKGERECVDADCPEQRHTLIC